MKYLYPLLLLIPFTSCTSETSSEEEELYNFLQGTFTSEKQAQQDTTYYDITLHLEHIWEEQDDHLWIYAEQSLSNAAESPYAQRIYKIFRDSEDRLLMEPYELDSQADFAEAWKEPESFDSLSPANLSRQPGCTLIFRKENDSFIGETENKDCKSLSPSSEYAISQFIVSEDEIINWSRGYDKEDNMVWGKTEGGYILEKVK